MLNAKTIELISRIGIGILNAWNKFKAKKAVDDPANNLANGGELFESDQTFTDLSAKIKRHKAK